MNKLNERFADLADLVSEGMGRWWVTALSVLLIAIWTLYCLLTQGPGWWYGQFYNFPLNLTTTVAELWIGFLLAAAANRVEKRNKALQEQQLKIIQHIERTAAREEQEVADAEQRLLQEDRRMEAIMEHLDKQDDMLVRIFEK